MNHKAKITYVKSCKITLAGLNGISTSAFWFLTQSRIFSTSEDSTLNSSQFLTADSNKTLMEYGSASKIVNINKCKKKNLLSLLSLRDGNL